MSEEAHKYAYSLTSAASLSLNSSQRIMNIGQSFTVYGKKLLHTWADSTTYRPQAVVGSRNVFSQERGFNFLQV